MICTACGHENPDAARFCSDCGSALASRSDTPAHLAEKIRAGRDAMEGERKQVTVLFADVLGSMDLSEQTDVEEWRAIMSRFFAVLSDGVHRFEGTVDKFTGDGIMALFGAPIAHEDHAVRACLAALHLQRQLAHDAGAFGAEHGLGLPVRMGLNSGEVVVGTIGEDMGMAYTAIGHTVGLAQRMEQLAEPGKVFLSEHTASLVTGHFELQDLGDFQVKGAGGTLGVHELVGVGAARGRLDVSRARGFARFVGRDDELALLRSAQTRASAGHGQVIGIVGDAGVGKSRLCHELAEGCRAQGIPVHQLAGQAHAKSVPLLPVLQFLRDYFEIDEGDSDRTARERIGSKLLLLDDPLDDEDLPLLFEFLAVPDPARPTVRMDPEARQRQLLTLMQRLGRAESAQRPAVILVEDLHWLDPASAAFLMNQAAAVEGTRTLMVLNFRPEYQAPWSSLPGYRQIALAPLVPEAVDKLLADLVGSEPSLDGLTKLIGERAEGNPFFVEELVRSLVETGTLTGERGAYGLVRPVTAAAMPASVHAVLAARIDALGQRDKAVLHAAAVIGREFPKPVLEQVVELAPAELEEALARLVGDEFAYQKDTHPEALYAFKHPLTQEVAYRSQLSERRALVHARVARAIIEQYPDRLDERSALLAQHFEAGGEKLPAARWHARAAAWSGTSDPTQALEHWRPVRALTDTLRESPESAALGLRARISLLAYGWRLGISRAEAAALFDEAEQIASRNGDVRSRAMLLMAYGAVRGMSQGDMGAYAELASQAIALADELGDPALYMALTPSAFALFATGQHREAVATLDRAIELAAGDPTVGAGGTLGCPYAYCHAVKGLNVVNLGDLVEARRLLDEGAAIAAEQQDSETVGLSHMYSAWLEYFAGEPRAALGHAREALKTAERIGGQFSRVYAWLFLGLAELMQRDWQAAIAALGRSLAIARERQPDADGGSLRLALLAEAYLGLGDTDQAQALAAQAVAVAVARGQVSNETYANLALARVLLVTTGPHGREQIEAALARAIELAGDTGAKAFAPLVHAELAELGRQCGDEPRYSRELHEAHRLFEEIGATGHAKRLTAELLAMPAG